VTDGDAEVAMTRKHAERDFHNAAEDGLDDEEGG
jgi:hypothetical protein